MMFLILSTGHGWQEIEEEWDLPRVERWIAYCQKHPPLQWMVAAYLGFDKPGKGESMRVTEDNFESFARMLKGGGGMLNG